MSARISFEHELNLLHDDLIRMGQLIEAALDSAAQALEHYDRELAEEIVKGDRLINDMEKSIEARSLNLILRQQPVAKDLRQVSAALKVVTDMERIGDHASDIAELLLAMDSPCIHPSIKHIPGMAMAAREMVQNALDVFIKEDLENAAIIEKQDDIIDDLFKKVKGEVIEMLKISPEQSDQGINVLMIAKYLERVGDHAVNICEWTEFSRTGNVNHIKLI